MSFSFWGMAFQSGEDEGNSIIALYQKREDTSKLKIQWIMKGENIVWIQYDTFFIAQKPNSIVFPQLAPHYWVCFSKFSYTFPSAYLL